MAKNTDKPFVPASTQMAELTVKAVLLGVLMAIGLGAANAYLGMKAGLTVAATFPAAVVAMAALRILGGTVLEENVARTTASVGEALVAGAIFTIPAFMATLVRPAFCRFNTLFTIFIAYIQLKHIGNKFRTGTNLEPVFLILADLIVQTYTSKQNRLLYMPRRKGANDLIFIPDVPRHSF